MTARSVSLAAALCLAALISVQAAVQTPQNQSPTAPQRPGAPATSGNQTPTAPAEPPATPGVPIYINPGIVQLIQKKLVSMGFPVPSVSGAWGETSSAALAQFQAKNGLEAGGDLDELTIGALGLPQVLRGELPPGAEAPVSPQAEATGGGPLSASPRLTRLVQSKLTEAGHPTDNLFGVWLAGSDTAVRNYQKAKGLDITASLDLRLLNALGVIGSLVDPKPGKLPTDSVVQILADKAVIYTGAPLSIGPAGVRQIQLALQQRGFRDLTVDGKWSESVAAAVKKFQESQKLEATGSVNLRTLKALGFNNPLGDLDQAAVATPKQTK